MKTLTLLLTAASLSLLTAAAAAKPSTPSEYRGYQACLAANDNLRGLVVEREYLLAETGQSRTYYINGTAWKDGKRVDVGFTCLTSRSGVLLENRGVTFARFVPDADPVRVAKN